MSTFTTDANVANALSQLKEITVIHDPSGRVVGVFMPKDLAEKQLLYEKAKQLFDPAEMERRLREERDKGIPLQEVWKQIRAREKQ